jgi:hypothetical protein
LAEEQSTNENNNDSQHSRNKQIAQLGSKFIWSSLEADAIFKDMTPVELSMISLYNPITTFAIEGSYYKSMSPVYYIVNDIIDITTKLPWNINEKDFAILRSIKSTGKLKDYYYRPSMVLAALNFLIANNHLYKDISIDMTVFTSRNVDPESNLPILLECTMDITLEESNELEAPNDNSGNSIEKRQAIKIINNNINSSCLYISCCLSGENPQDLLLMGSHITNETQEDIIENALADTSTDKELSDKIIQRGGNATFAKAYDDKYFLEKCFPQYFPYGLGGPSLLSHGSVALNIKQFSSYVLKGDIARCHQFQNDFRFISVCYYIVMRHQIRGKVAINIIGFI